MDAPFTDFEADFLRFTREIVWCAVTTVGPDARPRARILHPFWEIADARPVGWILTRRSPIKTAHLAHSPYVSCVYWRPNHDTVLAECNATWDEHADHIDRVWGHFAADPPPLGYDPSTIWAAGPTDPDLALLKLDPWRVQLVTIQTLTTRQRRVWRSGSECVVSR